MFGRSRAPRRPSRLIRSFGSRPSGLPFLICTRGRAGSSGFEPLGLLAGVAGGELPAVRQPARRCQDERRVVVVVAGAVGSQERSGARGIEQREDGDVLAVDHHVLRAVGAAGVYPAELVAAVLAHEVDADAQVVRELPIDAERELIRIRGLHVRVDPELRARIGPGDERRVAVGGGVEPVEIAHRAAGMQILELAEEQRQVVPPGDAAQHGLAVAGQPHVAADAGRERVPVHHLAESLQRADLVELAVELRDVLADPDHPVEAPADFQGDAPHVHFVLGPDRLRLADRAACVRTDEGRQVRTAGRGRCRARRRARSGRRHPCSGKSARRTTGCG